MTPATLSDARVSPHNLEAERSILGAILLENDLLAEACEHLTVGAFYRHAHNQIFRTMVDLAERHVAIDLVTLREELGEHDLDDVGGPAYITSLVDGMPHGSNIGDYARIVRDKSKLRTIIASAQRMQAAAYEADEDPQVVIDRAEQVLFDLARGEERTGFRQLRDILPGVLEQIERWHRTKAGVTGLASGFQDLDAVTCGFQPGELIVIGSRPSMGKSSLILNIAQHVGLAGKSVGLFSLEMSEMDLAIRMLAAQAHIDGHRLRSGYVGQSQWPGLSQALVDLAALKVFIDESPFITVFEMRSRARRLKAQDGLDLLIIDYTQLMVGHERQETRALELGSISRSLKALAKDLKIPILALSQLSRKCEERTDKRPMLSDLRESGALEQDADVVMFLYRDEVYHKDTQDFGVAEVSIAKQRNGPIGTVKLAWIGAETRFANLITAAAAPHDQHLPMGDR